MAKLEATISALITELKRIQAPGSFPENEADSFSIPGQIAAGDGRFILTSREMERLIKIASREFKRNDSVLARTHTDRELNSIVRSALGPALANVDLDDDPDQSAVSVLNKIQSSVKPDQVSSECEYALGCTLFGKSDIAPFDIGPVRFEPCLEWLGKKSKENKISKTTERRIRSNWAGVKLRKRRNTLDAWRERHVLDAIHTCPYVCSVHTFDLAPEAGWLRAQTAARLAMTAVALCWQVPSRILDGFNLLVDRDMRRQRQMAFMPGKESRFGGYLQGLPHGSNINPSEWVAELERNRKHFDVAGEAITYFLSSTGKICRPALMNTLVQSLLWFHEGCREQVAPMAVVKFVASLDALAAGGKAGGIERLITARLRIQPDQAIRKGGLTMKTAIRELYSDARSRTIHGTNDKIGHDWTSTRVLGEQFARLSLIAALDWSAKHPQSDDPIKLPQ